MLTSNIVKQDKEGKLNITNGGIRTNGTNRTKGVNGTSGRIGTRDGIRASGGNINSYSAEDVYTVEPYVMNTKQAAVFLGCSEYMIRELCRRKELPHLRLGNKPQGRLLFTEKALIQYIEKRERSSWR